MKRRSPSPLRTAPGLAALGALAAGAVVSVVGMPFGAAADGPITCGSVVTSDVRLSTDLLDCPGAGLVIGASGVTIDLAGHVIDGTGSGTGIDNGAGHNDVRLTGGTIREFQFGLYFFEATGGRVDRIEVRSSTIGVIVSRSADVVLDRVTAVDNIASGIEVTFSNRTIVRRSTASDNGHGGIVDLGSEASRYERNDIVGNVAPGLALWQSDGSVVRRNHVTANDSDGIELTGVDAAVVEGNHAIANAGNGISIDEPGSTVRRNRAIENQGIGIAAADGTIDGGRNRAHGNAGGACTAVACP